MTILLNHLLQIIGYLLLGLAILGVFIPILPTTPLALVALACFSKSSPRLRAWLWNHPTLGPHIRDWKSYGVIRRKAKLKAVGLIGISFGLSLHYAELSKWGILLLTITLGAVTVFILSRPGQPSKTIVSS